MELRRALIFAPHRFEKGSPQGSWITLSKIHSCTVGSSMITGTLICPEAIFAFSPFHCRYSANVPAFTIRIVGIRICPSSSKSWCLSLATTRVSNSFRDAWCAFGPIDNWIGQWSLVHQTTCQRPDVPSGLASSMKKPKVGSSVRSSSTVVNSCTRTVSSELCK